MPPSVSGITKPERRLLHHADILLSRSYGSPVNHLFIDWTEKPKMGLGAPWVSCSAFKPVFWLKGLEAILRFWSVFRFKVLGEEQCQADEPSEKTGDPTMLRDFSTSYPWNKWLFLPGKDGGELWGTQMLADPLRSSLRRHRSSRSSRLGDSRGIFVTADHSAIVDVLQVETVFLFVVTVMSIILDPLVSWMFGIS